MNDPFPMLPAKRELLTCGQVARAFGVAPNTVRHWCREGVWRGRVKQTESGHYRIPRAMVEELLTLGDPSLNPPSTRRR